MVVYYIPNEREPRTVVYTCEDSYNEGKYMVSIHQTDGAVWYTCMEFTIRSHNVVQLRLAEPVHVKSPALCADVYMQLQEAPLVYFHVYDNWVAERLPLNSYLPCPLEGGYIIREWFDESGRAAYEADSQMPPIKLENECEKGEGLKFVCDRNRAKCPLPHTALHESNNFCLASWIDGENTYMLVHNAEDDRLVPCIRYPTKHGRSFTAYIFLDGVCDRGDPITQSKMYRKVSLLKEVEEYCGDRTRSCTSIDRHKCVRGLSHYCRHTCGVCNNPSAIWKTMRVYPEFRGTWVKDTYNMGYENILFDHEHVTIPSLGRYRLYEKYWYQPEEESHQGLNKYSRQYSPQTLKKEYLMISQYDNGCSPRVSLLNIAKRSNSVLSLRISQPVVIEHFGQNQQALEKMDQAVSFTKKPSSVVYEMYRNQPGNWFNVVLREERPAMVPCHIDYTHFRILLDEGRRYCEGNVKMVDAYNFEMTFRACNGSATPGGSNEPPPPTQFECLASFDGDYGNTYMVTRMLGGLRELVGHRYMCWAFSRTRRDTVYWMRTSDCDVSTEDYIHTGARFPLATVNMLDRSEDDGPSEYSKWLVCFLLFFYWLFGG